MNGNLLPPKNLGPIPDKHSYPPVTFFEKNGLYWAGFDSTLEWIKIRLVWPAITLADILILSFVISYSVFYFKESSRDMKVFLVMLMLILSLIFCSFLCLIITIWLECYKCGLKRIEWFRNGELENLKWPIT
jgi:hypothetical protein